MPQDISYSDGRTVNNAVVVVWEDHSTESRHVHYRAFWADSPEGTSGCPVIGYCSPGGSHRTIRAVAEEVQRYHPGEPVYRNGRLVKV